MKSSAPGKSTSSAEVQDITPHGVWLLANGREYFLPFDQYPWFRNAKVADVYNVCLLHGTHLHWPSLDIDLEVDALDRPEDYPLIYRKAIRSGLKDIKAGRTVSLRSFAKSTKSRY